MLVVGTGLLLRSLSGMQSLDLGFKPDNVTIFTLNLPALRYPAPADVFRTFDQLEDEFKTLPGVDKVSPYFRDRRAERIRKRSELYLPEPDGRLGDSEKIPPVFVPCRRCGLLPDHGHFADVRSRFHARRSHDWRGDHQPEDGRSVLEWRRACRQNFTNHRRTAADGHRRGFECTISQELTTESQPEIYLTQPPARTLTFVLRSAVPTAQLLGSVRQIVRRTDPNLPLIRPGTMMALVELQMAQTRFVFLLAGLFALLAIVLAGVGTYGVVAYAVVQRTREIGLRLALGASPTRLLLQIMWQGFRPAVLGLVVGAAAAYATSRAMQSLLFQIRPNDPATFITVIAVLSALALVATAIPARRATQISPASTLKDG